jgi:hypothetical protein
MTTQAAERRKITKPELAEKIAETLVRASQRGNGGTLSMDEAREMLATLAAHPHSRHWERVRAERNLLKQVIDIYVRMPEDGTITL